MGCDGGPPEDDVGTEVGISLVLAPAGPAAGAIEVVDEITVDIRDEL